MIRLILILVLVAILSGCAIFDLIFKHPEDWNDEEGEARAESPIRKIASDRTKIQFGEILDSFTSPNQFDKFVPQKLIWNPFEKVKLSDEFLAYETERDKERIRQEWKSDDSKYRVTWEYKVVYASSKGNLSVKLHLLGAEGWELVAVTYYAGEYTAFLKRHCPNNKNELTQEEHSFLLKSQKDLLELEALTKEGLGK